MKIKSFLLCSLLIFGFLPPYNFAQSEYQEVYTSQGKVIIGLSEEEAMEKFGPPASAAGPVPAYAGIRAAGPESERWQPRCGLPGSSGLGGARQE